MVEYIREALPACTEAVSAVGVSLSSYLRCRKAE